MTFRCYKMTRRSFNNALAGFPSFIKDPVEQLIELLPLGAILLQRNPFSVGAFGCGSWTGGSQSQAVVVNTQRIYSGSHWQAWCGILLPTNEHLVPLCSWHINIYSQGIWETHRRLPDVTRSRRRSLARSPDNKWNRDLRAPQLILVTAYKYRLQAFI